MGKHYHDPYRPHAARPVPVDPPPEFSPAQVSPDEDPEPSVVEPPQEPSVPDDTVSDADVEPEVASDTVVADDESPDLDKNLEPVPDKVVEPMDPPPQFGPGSSADAWRAYAAEVTATPSETWANATRAAIIQTLREQGYAVEAGDL